MRLRVTALLLLLCFWIVSAQADEPLLDPAAQRMWTPFLRVETDFPLFLGGGAGVRWKENLSLGISYGLIPKGYGRTIGRAIDRFGDSDGYDNVIGNGVDSSQLWKISLDYHFSGRAGWSVGSRFYSLDSEGNEGISEIETLTGTTFPVLRAILQAQGRELLFLAKFSMTVLELHTAYTWALGRDFYLEALFGVGKVLSSTVALSSSAPNFDSSQAGQNAYRDAQNQLQETLSKYGYSPFLGLALIYEF